MRVLRLSSSLPKDALLARCVEAGIAAVSPSLVASEEEIALAALLAERSFANNSNLAKTVELEFLLWLSGEKDLRRALAKNSFSPDDFLAVQLIKNCRLNIPAALSAKKKPLALRKRAADLELERISTSRI